MLLEYEEDNKRRRRKQLIQRERFQITLIHSNSSFGNSQSSSTFLRQPHNSIGFEENQLFDRRRDLRRE